MEQHTYFITGSSGFVGANLALRLARQGHRVNALVRNSIDEKLKGFSNVKLIHGDVRDTAALVKGMENADYVFHLAAIAQPWIPDNSLYFKVNVEGTEIVLNTAREQKVKKVVITSSAGALGPQKNSSPVTEKTQSPVKPFTEYEFTKIQVNNMVRKAGGQGVPVCAVSPTRVFGPGALNQSNSVTLLIKRFLEGKWRFMPGDGKRIGNYAFIDDVVNGHILALEKGRPGENYLLGGENISYNEFFRQINEVAGRHHKLINLPLPAMLTYGRLNELYAAVFRKKPMITSPWVKKYLHDWAVDLNKASTELGYTITPFKEGVQKTIAWLKDQQP